MTFVSPPPHRGVPWHSRSLMFTAPVMADAQSCQPAPGVIRPDHEVYYARLINTVTVVTGEIR